MPGRTVPSRMPSGPTYCGTMNGRAAPSAVPSATAAVPSTTAAASRQRGRSNQCSADCDRRCETSQFSFTHGVAPKDNVAPTQSGTGALNYSTNGKLNFAIAARADAAVRGRRETDKVMNKNSCPRDCAFARSGMQTSCVQGAGDYFARRSARRFAAALNSRRGAWRSRCRSKYCRRRSNALRRLSRAAVRSRSRSGPCDRPSPQSRR
jgi:hypothetical protein